VYCTLFTCVQWCGLAIGWRRNQGRGMQEIWLRGGRTGDSTVEKCVDSVKWTQGSVVGFRLKYMVAQKVSHYRESSLNRIKSRRRG